MSLWQQLGAFVYTGENLSDDQLQKFANVGGKWIVPVVYGDTTAGPWNLSNLSGLKTRASKVGIQTGGWFDCFGGDVEKDAQAINTIVRQNGLYLTILDLEAAYQYPGGDPNLMPALVKRLRQLLPTNHPLCVSTNGMNDAMIWNGRTLSPAQSFYDLGVRVAPQWYSSPHYSGCWTDPVCNMKWLHDNGATDGNFSDKTAPHGRGVPLSYVHPTVEVTGLEGASLSTSLQSLTAAQKYGYTTGLSIYTLENTPDSDFPLLASFRDKLYLS